MIVYMTLTKSDLTSIAGLLKKNNGEIIEAMSKGFTSLDQRIDGVEERLDKTDDRFDKMDDRLDTISKNTSEINYRVVRIEKIHPKGTHSSLKIKVN